MLDLSAHFLDDLLGKSVVVSGGSDEDRWVNSSDRLDKTNVSIRVSPMTSFLNRLSVGLLVVG